MTKWGRSQKLKPPDAKFFALLRKDLIRCLREICFSDPGENIHVVYYDVRSQKRLRITKDAQHRTEFWIALDDVYVSESDFSIDVTRLYSKQGPLNEHGSRPREGVDVFPDLEQSESTSKGSDLSVQIDQCGRA